MDVLLDTCTFIFLCDGDPKLSIDAQKIILDPRNRCFFSLASVWEMAIKTNPARTGQKRLQFSKPLDVFLPEYLDLYAIELLPVDLSHSLKVANLPVGHADPFDRLIIAQSLVLSIPVISNDAQFDAFGVNSIW